VISAVDVLAIHDLVIEQTGGSHGVRDEAGLLGAVGRPFPSFGGEDLFPDPWMKAAALLEGLCNSHPFVDGNKRTALVAAAWLLHELGIEIAVPLEDGEEFMLRVAQGFDDLEAIAGQLQAWRV
jgi:death-on-curing protein